MSFIPTDDPRVSRDPYSHALVATNMAELQKHRANRNFTKRLLQQRETTDEKFRQMDERLDRCEIMLQELVHHVSTLVARTTTVKSQE